MDQAVLIRSIRPGVAVILILGGFFISGCTYSSYDKSIQEYVAPSSASPWKPTEETTTETTPASAPVDIPEKLLKQGSKWKLADIIEVALRNSPDTRQTWYAARSAAADWLSTKGNRYPGIDATAGMSRMDVLTSTAPSASRTIPSATSFTSSVGLTWLLFDFGGRSASIEEKRRTLLAADFSHNAAIQDQVFTVIQAYFQYANARALEKALETSVNEASTNLGAAEDRHRNGLATIADVLQAKTSLSQARLNLESTKGQVKTIRGALATAMGIPANTPYDIEDLPMAPPVDHASEAVEEYIKQAEKNSPDLAAQKNRVEASIAQTKVSRSDIYPSISVGDTLASEYSKLSSQFDADNIASIQIKIPLWKGRSMRYNLLKSEQDAENQKAKLQSLRQNIILQVWSSYYTLQTSVHRVKAAGDLMASAEQSYEVALGRYKEGVGALLDLLSAQSALMNARAQQISAQSDWYTSFSQLARDTGMLWSDNEKDNKKLLDTFPTAIIKEQH